MGRPAATKQQSGIQNKTVCFACVVLDRTSSYISHPFNVVLGQSNFPVEGERAPKIIPMMTRLFLKRGRASESLQREKWTENERNLRKNAGNSLIPLLRRDHSGSLHIFCTCTSSLYAAAIKPHKPEGGERRISAAYMYDLGH